MDPSFASRPPGPPWFEWAVAQVPEVGRVPVDEVEIEYLCWGEKDAPGVLLVHGGFAHAHWWSFIAPYLAADHRVASLSFSGMGLSGHRASYDLPTFEREICAVAKAAGLDRPMLVGHSFGAAMVGAALIRWPDSFAGAILIDGYPAEPPPPGTFRSIPARPRHNYATLEEAVARFRLSPPQDYENGFIVDWLARGALRQTAAGWRWAADSALSGQILSGLAHSVGRLPDDCSTSYIYGDRSLIVSPGALETLRDRLPEGAPVIAIPDSGHHIMVDQPLALIEALKALLTR